MKISTLPAFRLLAVLAVVLILLTGIPFPTQANEPLKFIGVDLNLNRVKNPTADNKLVQYLTTKSINVNEKEAESYEKMIRKLVSDELYLARVTPYVFVVASMLGADFDVLATYQSKSSTRSTTYRAYFVINRTEFDSQPTLDQLMQKLREPQTAARFLYHDKFSTSSYFLPTLFFRANDIYVMPTSNDKLKAIISQDINDPPGQQRFSSDELISRVADQKPGVSAQKPGAADQKPGAADQKPVEMIVAAVWDYPKENVPASVAEKVYFVPLPTILPNDLLVCSAKIDQQTKADLRNAIKYMPPSQIDDGDVKTWVDIESARDARQALGELRQLAKQRATAVTIRITAEQEHRSLEEEIKNAIRLSNTEFIPFDAKYHENADVDWKVVKIHSGALKLVSTVNYADLEPQEFEISFTDDTEDLTKRMGNIIHSRMHRIRYVWPYEDRPTVIRDVDFPILPNSVFKVIKITWKDPKRNDFYEDDPFEATVSKTLKPNSFGFQLEGAGFPSKFDPMSNTSYRVVLVRETKEGRVFTILTYGLVGLFVLAAAGAIFDLRRRAKKLRDLPIVSKEDFKRKCRELAENNRNFWRGRKLRDIDVVWCDRTRLDELIADLKADRTCNFRFDEKITLTRRMAAQIPIVNKYLGLAVGADYTTVITIDPGACSDTKRLGLTLAELMTNNALSPFVGEKLEWDAFDQMTTDIFEPFRIEEANLNGNGNGNGNGKPPETRTPTKSKVRRTDANLRRRISRAVSNGNTALIRSEHPMILSAVTQHFNQVIEDSKERVCFFGKHWQVKKNRTVIHLTCSAQLQSPLQLNGSKSTFNKLTLHAAIPRSAKTDEFAKSKESNAWLFGKVIDVGRNGSAQTLLLTFEPTAVVRTDDQE